jgi:hypothetical protein
MSDAIATELLRQGLLGALFLGAIIVIWKLYVAKEADRKEFQVLLKAEQNLRIEDGKAHQRELLELTRTTVAGLGTMTNAAVGQKEALGEVRASIREQNEVVIDAIDKLQQLLQMHSAARRP